MSKLEDIGWSIVEGIKTNLGDRANGSMGRSLEVRATNDGVDILAAPYFEYYEVGRGPGGVPENFEIILQDWISRYSIPVPPKFNDDLEFANAIKWKTIKAGSSKYRGDRPKDDAIGSVVDDVLDKTDLVEAFNLNDLLQF